MEKIHSYPSTTKKYNTNMKLHNSNMFTNIKNHTHVCTRFSFQG